jgi:hypothetical protein
MWHTLTFVPHTFLKPFHTMAQRYHPYRPAQVAPNRPCYFFKKGQCSKDSCMFAHEFIPCEQNPCNDIARCPFVHPGEPGYAVQQAPQAQPRTFRPAAPAYVRPCFFFKKGKCAKGKACPFPHALTPCESIPCPDQNKCPFLHPGETVTPISIAEVYQQYQPPAAYRPVQAAAYTNDHYGNSASQPSERPCFFFKRGQCTKAETCPFVHHMIPCTQGDNCPNLVKCPYSHPSEATPEQQ